MAGQTSPVGHDFLFPSTQVGRGETLWWVIEDSDLCSPGSHPHPTQWQQSADAEQPLSLSTVARLQGQDWDVQAPDLWSLEQRKQRGINNRAVAAAVPLLVAAVEIDEITALDALGTSQSPASGVAQRTPLDRHVQPLCVVHRVHQVSS